MIRPCDLPENSKKRSIGSAEPVRSVTVMKEITNTVCRFDLPVIESTKGIIIFDRNLTKIIKRFSPINFSDPKQSWFRGLPLRSPFAFLAP